MTTVRDIAERDMPAWRELFRAYGVFYDTEFDDAQLDHVAALVLTAGSGVDALIAEDETGRVIGFAHYRSHPDTFSAGRDWFLDDLFVDQGTRGAGAGSALVEAVADRARQAGSAGTLRWITAESNARAQRVYDRVARRTTWVTYEKAL